MYDDRDKDSERYTSREGTKESSNLSLLHPNMRLLEELREVFTPHLSTRAQDCKHLPWRNYETRTSKAAHENAILFSTSSGEEICTHQNISNFLILENFEIFFSAFEKAGRLGQLDMCQQFDYYDKEIDGNSLLQITQARIIYYSVVRVTHLPKDEAIAEVFLKAVSEMICRDLCQLEVAKYSEQKLVDVNIHDQIEKYLFSQLNNYPEIRESIGVTIEIVNRYREERSTYDLMEWCIAQSEPNFSELDSQSIIKEVKKQIELSDILIRYEQALRPIIERHCWAEPIETLNLALKSYQLINLCYDISSTVTLEFIENASPHFEMRGSDILIWLNEGDGDPLFYHYLENKNGEHNIDLVHSTIDKWLQGSSSLKELCCNLGLSMAPEERGFITDFFSYLKFWRDFALERSIKIRFGSTIDLTNISSCILNINNSNITFYYDHFNLARCRSKEVNLTTTDFTYLYDEFNTSAATRYCVHQLMNKFEPGQFKASAVSQEDICSALAQVGVQKELVSELSIDKIVIFIKSRSKDDPSDDLPINVESDDLVIV